MPTTLKVMKNEADCCLFRVSVSFPTRRLPTVSTHICAIQIVVSIRFRTYAYTDSESPKYQPLFSNLPSGLLPKIATLRHRLTSRILNYLTGSFTLPRGWTFLTILLYALLFILLLYLRTTIIVSG